MGTSEDEDIQEDWDEDVRRKFSRIFRQGRPRTSIFEKVSDEEGQGEDRDGDEDGEDVDVLRRPALERCSGSTSACLLKLSF